MSLKKCEKCGEMVGVAKAFCPECGHSFVVEEKREGSSEFDKYAGTINVSKTAYSLMLANLDDESSIPVDDSLKNSPPVASPPVASPPVASPPVASPPVSNPPVSSPPVSSPAVLSPPGQNTKPGSKRKFIYKLLAALILLELVVAAFLVWYIYF